MNTPISELDRLTETEKRFRAYERLEEFHASNGDWAAVMLDKWSLASWGQKGGN